MSELTEKQMVEDRLEAAINILSSVETKPTVVDLYYPVKREGGGTGWNYHVAYVTLDLLKLVHKHLKESS